MTNSEVCMCLLRTRNIFDLTLISDTVIISAIEIEYSIDNNIICCLLV